MRGDAVRNDENSAHFALVPRRLDPQPIRQQGNHVVRLTFALAKAEQPPPTAIVKQHAAPRLDAAEPMVIVTVQ